jgi:hypothetical protein
MKKKRRTILPPDDQASLREACERLRSDPSLAKAVDAIHAPKQQQYGASVKAAVDAVHAGDMQRFMETLEAIDENCLWRAFMKAVSARPCPEKFRRSFLDGYIRKGDHIRSEVGDDLILIDGLRSLLPHYTGPGMTLYRGEGALNRSRRTYGLAWTASREVARHYARGDWQETKGGSVLLQAYAPNEAFICAPGLINNRYGEQEYLVDRRRLTNIRVVERFCYRSPRARP